MIKKGIITVAGIFILLVTLGLLMNDAFAGDVVYLKNNIHYQQGRRDAKASYANWTNPGGGHRILPVNTGIRIDRFKRGFAIISAEDGTKIYFEYNVQDW